MNWKDAVHKTVHAAGGASVVAARMEASAAVIRAKANPNDDSRTFYLNEAIELMSLTNDHRILHSLADEFGYQLTEVPENVDSADRALVYMITDSLRGNDTETDIRRTLKAMHDQANPALRKKIHRLQAYLANLAQAIDD